MMSSAPEPPTVRKPIDLGPLMLERCDDRWRLTLTAPTEMTLELPPDYEQFVRERFQKLLGTKAGPRVEMDLEHLPAISSRQLGLMLALQKALAGRWERLRVTGVSEGVRRLLDLTRTAQFFELD